MIRKCLDFIKIAAKYAPAYWPGRLSANSPETVCIRNILPPGRRGRRPLREEMFHSKM